MNKQKLNEELTEQMGLCWHDYRRSDEIDFNAPNMKHLGSYNGYVFRCLKCGESTDSLLDVYHSGYNFTESLDTIFERLVPEAVKRFGDVTVSNLLARWASGVAYGKHKRGEEAFGLAKAVKKLIEEEK